MLSSLLTVLKSRYFWVTIGVATLISLTLVVGSWLGWTMVTQLLIVIGLLVVYLAFFLVEFIRARRNAQKIEDSITMQGAEDEGRSAAKQAEIDELEDRLEEAITTLKNSKLGRGQTGSTALHALPWYMFVGPPGAGKTTAIRNSGLHFPMGDNGVRGIGGTRNCDWFFSDQAILLDTAGRYMTEKEDEEEWHAFLDMLKKRRTGRPINGVIVGISVEELVDAAPEDIEWHADNIRRRVSELVERLEVRFPVYLVFTKCDLLQGFVEFFGDQSKAEREDVWGATLEDEQRREAAPRALFEDEFDRLYESLIGLRSERLSQSMSAEERRRVYAFPLEFSSVKEPLSRFVDQLFRENPYQETPEFRGFYFTSGTQEGTPIDRVLASFSSEVDVEAGPDAEAGDQTGKSYFISDLFSEVIIPDQYRVSKTTRSARRGQLVRWGTAIASAGVLGLFTLFAGQAVMESKDTLHRLRDVSREVAAVDWEQEESLQNVEALDRLRTEISQVEQYNEDPPLLRWGFHPGEDVLAPARDLFGQKMRPFVRRQFQRIEQELRNARSISGSLEQERRLELRETLRAYLLLSEEAGRLRETREQRLLRNYLTAAATQDTGTVRTAQLRGRSGQVEAQIRRFVTQMDRGAVQGFEARSALVRDIRRMIYRKPTVENLYSKIKQEGTNSLQPIRLSDILQKSGQAALFATRPRVSGFFTKQGWNSYVKQRIEEAAEDPGKGDWVLGERSEFSSDELQDTDQIVTALRDRYFRDYTSAWKQFLRNVRYRSFGTVGETARALRQLGDPFSSPVLYVLARAAQETQFASSMADQAQDQLSEEVETRAQAKVRQRTRSSGNLGSTNEETPTVHPVTRRFVGLHRLEASKAASGEASSNLTRSLKAVGRVGDVLQRINTNPEKATEVAVQVLDGGGDVRTSLNTVRNNLTQIDADARRQLFDQTILQAWDRVLRVVQERLNRQWRGMVHRSYEEKLDGRYPFSASTQDARLSDVKRFFHPQTGVVATFEKENLAPLLQDGERKPRTWEGRGIEFSEQARSFFESADRIGDQLFAGGNLHLRFELVPDLPRTSGSAPAISQVFLRVHGTEQTYEMGYRPTTTVTWPADRGARLVLSTRAQTLAPKQKEGAWAWFRLLEEAEVEPRTQNEYQLRWSFDERNRFSAVARYTLRTDRARRLFESPRQFFDVRVPDSL